MQLIRRQLEVASWSHVNDSSLLITTASQICRDVNFAASIESARPSDRPGCAFANHSLVHTRLRSRPAGVIFCS